NRAEGISARYRRLYLPAPAHREAVGRHAGTRGAKAPGKVDRGIGAREHERVEIDAVEVAAAQAVPGCRWRGLYGDRQLIGRSQRTIARAQPEDVAAGRGEARARAQGAGVAERDRTGATDLAPGRRQGA